MSTQNERILILDFGAQYAQLIARRVREQNVFCQLVRHDLTAKRVAEVIDRTFGVRYHRDHVGRLLREAGWSRQQPIERATQRDEEAIKAWYEQRWPAIKKKPKRTSRPLSG